MKSAKDKPKSVIIVTLDALRADHVGCYGYPLDTTPTLDRLASQSIVFDYAFCPMAATDPSHTSLLTGKYTRFHSIGFHNGDRQLNHEQEVTLPLIFKDLGYQTAAFVSILPLYKKIGLDLGFDLYDDNMPDLRELKVLRRNADQTAAAVINWIGEHQADPFFVWVHFSEPHGPFYPPEPYNNTFVGNPHYGNPVSLPAVADNAEGGIPEYQLLKASRGVDSQLVDYERDARYYTAQYDGNIRFVDAHLEMLINKLKEWHLYDDTLLVITADHGEALGENNVYFCHGLTVSVDQIRVPLIIKPPAWSHLKKRRVAAPVASVDIMPTILGFYDMDEQYLGIQGLNLLPFLRNNTKEPWLKRYIFSEIPGQLSVINGNYQLLYDKGREAAKIFSYPAYVPAIEGNKLYDYVKDPSGKEDVAAKYPDINQQLLKVAERYLKIPAPQYTEVPVSLASELEAAELKKRMKQLGYD